MVVVERRRRSRRLPDEAPRLPKGLIQRARSLSDDEDLLVLAISYVKRVRGNAPDFEARVAAVFEALKAETRR